MVRDEWPVLAASSTPPASPPASMISSSVFGAIRAPMIAPTKRPPVSASQKPDVTSAAVATSSAVVRVR